MSIRKNDYFINGLLFIIVVGLLIFGVSFFQPNIPPSHQVGVQQKNNTSLPNVTPADDAALAAREVIDHQVMGEGENAIVAYTYVGAHLPEKLDPKEALTLRTPSSYTILLKPIVKNAPETFKTISFPQPQFFQKGEAWYYIEYGYASKHAFDKAENKNPLYALFLTVANAATLAAFSGAGDGYIDTGASGSTGWDSGCPAQTCTGVHDATSTANIVGVAAVIDSTGTTVKAGDTVISCGKLCGAPELTRTWLPFDTSSIPQNSSITSATLSIWVTATTTGLAGSPSDTLYLVQSRQAANTTLVAADWGTVDGATPTTTAMTDGGSVTSTRLGQYSVITLTSTGRGWIKKNNQTSTCSSTKGITCFALVGSRDASDTSPGLSAAGQSTMSSSENTGTTQDPSLSVTYTTTFAPWMFEIF